MDFFFVLFHFFSFGAFITWFFNQYQSYIPFLLPIRHTEILPEKPKTKKKLSTYIWWAVFTLMLYWTSAIYISLFFPSFFFSFDSIKLFFVFVTIVNFFRFFLGVLLLWLWWLFLVFCFPWCSFTLFVFCFDFVCKAYAWRAVITMQSMLYIKKK